MSGIPANKLSLEESHQLIRILLLTFGFSELLVLSRNFQGGENDRFAPLRTPMGLPDRGVRGRLVTALDIFVPGNRPKTSSFRLPYQRHSSYADCARKLFKPPKDSASLLVPTRNNFFWCYFVSDVISEVVLGPFWLVLPGLGPNR